MPEGDQHLVFYREGGVYEEDLDQTNDVHSCRGNGNVTLLSCTAEGKEIDKSSPPLATMLAWGGFHLVLGVGVSFACI